MKIAQTSLNYGASRMTYTAHHKNFAPYVDGEGPAKRDAVAKKLGVLRRILNAVLNSRQRQADRQIAAFLARSGGRLTDDIERELMRRISTSNWSMRD
jgi:hypothetical protein